MNAYFTVEETNLLCIFGKKDRSVLIKELQDSIALFEEPDMQQIAHNCIARLDEMTDEEFDLVDMTADYDSEDGEE